MTLIFMYKVTNCGQRNCLCSCLGVCLFLGIGVLAAAYGGPLLLLTRTSTVGRIHDALK